MDLPLVVLGLGSNLGDSRQIILDAVKVLEGVLSDLRMASFYETAPMYVTDQNRFINTAVAGYFPQSNLISKNLATEEFHRGTPMELLSIINKIEAQFGRDRNHEKRWGERALDIDILLFGNSTVNERDLVIPHPRLKERRFALQPLLELLPDAAESGTGISYRSICEKLPDQGVSYRALLFSLDKKR